MRRRRKARFTWFPTLGTNYTSEGNSIWTTTFRIGLLAPELDNAVAPNTTRSGNPSLEVFPIVPDSTLQPSEQLGTTAVSLNDFVGGQDWILKRIVGKIHVGAIPISPQGGTQWTSVLFKCGFFVARSIDDNQAEVDLNDEEVDSLAADNVQNPWIWQRSWMLQPDSALTGSVQRFPRSTDEYGSVADGPHIDSKVSRRIRREERLWFSASVVGYDPSNTVVEDSVIDVSGLMDLRILGAMRKQRNSSAF